MIATSKMVSLVNRHGVLLVFSIKNLPKIPSLWSCLYPRSVMDWNWDDDGADDRVVDLWHARAQLMDSKKVVYSKWFRYRATVFSRDVFRAMLSLSLRSHGIHSLPHRPEERAILDSLESNSPQSTRALKREVNLEGKFFENTFQASLRELFRRFLVVGCGEVDDGAFPSLAIGATRLIFDELWYEAERLEEQEAWSTLRAVLKDQSPFLQHFRKYSLALNSSKSPSGRRGISSHD